VNVPWDHHGYFGDRVQYHSVSVGYPNAREQLASAIDFHNLHVLKIKFIYAVFMNAPEKSI